MSCRSAFAALLAIAAVSGCARQSARPAPAVATSVSVEAPETVLSKDWKSVIKPADSVRLTTLPAIWATALAEARNDRFSTAVEAEGALLDPDAALVRVAPPPGRYRCRIVRIGQAAARSGPSFARFKPYFCYIEAEGDLLTFVKGTGTKRPGGRLWAESETRLVFLGAVAERDRDPPPPYGADARRDRAGVLERIGEFRWRLTLPGRAPDDARLEMIELIPDTPPPTEPAQ
ncbi:MAG: DUF4893 domain-containing protein [Sphingomonadaceae bacterium]